MARRGEARQGEAGFFMKRKIEITMTELRRNLGDIARRVSLDKERIIVTKGGVPAFAIVPIEDLLTIDMLGGGEYLRGRKT